MSTVVLVTSAITVLSVAVYYFLTYNFNYWKSKGVVGPKPTFPFGNIKDLVLRKSPLYLFYADFYKDYPNEKYVGIYRFWNPVLIVRDYDLVKQIMIKDFSNFMERTKLSEKGLGLNIFAASSHNWKILRNKFSPTFTSGKLKNMFHLLNGHGDKFSDYVGTTINSAHNQEVDVYSLLTKYTKSGIASCAFGIDINISGDKLLDVLQNIDKIILKRSYAFDLMWMFPGILRKFNIDIFPSFISDFFNKLVQDIFDQRKGVPSNRNDFMDLIIEMKNSGGEISGPKTSDPAQRNILQLDDGIIAAQAFVFYFAGFETSAGTVTYLLHELAYQQSVQDRLVKEINEIIKQHGKLTYEALHQMTYLSQCVDETLRKYPIADPLDRMAMEDYKFPDSDLIIKKDTPIIVPIRAFHLDEKYYPDPMKFDPDRFAPENVTNKSSLPYFPFGIGPRNCIGMRFGLLSARLAVAKLLPRFKIEPASNSTYEIDYDTRTFTITSKKGVFLKIVPRDY